MRAWEGKHPDKCSVRAASSGPAPSPHLPLALSLPQTHCEPPRMRAGCERMQAPGSSQLALGCSWAGKSCVSPLEWHGLAQLRPCESFAPWASVTRVMGSTAAAAARDLLRQLREGGSGMERGTSPCLILGFSSGGFHRLCFHKLRRGALLLPSVEAGVLRFCSTPGQCSGHERSPHKQLGVGAEHLPSQRMALQSTPNPSP